MTINGNGLSIATSPDGLRWTKHPFSVINGHEFDSHNVILWDDQRGHFVAYVRFWLYGQRQFRRATSPDLYHWSKLEWVHGTDEHDPFNLDLYTPAVCKYSAAPNLFVMMTSVMLHRDRLFIYYKAHTFGHVLADGGGIGVGTMWRDGFVALKAGSREGVLTTKTLAFSHDGPATPNKGRLTLNLDASNGWAKVEVLDLNGIPIPGFRKEDCDPIKSDSTLHIVTWQGKRAIDNLMGLPLKLRFYLYNSKLYSFRFLAYGTRQ